MATPKQLHHKWTDKLSGSKHLRQTCALFVKNGKYQLRSRGIDEVVVHLSVCADCCGACHWPSTTSQQ